MQVYFIGHRNIEKTEQLILSLRENVERLINRGVTTFLFGSKSEFNKLSWEIVTELKEKYPFIKRVYVRSAYQDIDENYKRYLLELYEETYFAIKLKNAGKYSYVERNYEMIDNSTYCIFYYNKDYNPLLTSRKSGTKTAYEYAIKKKKEIINLYKNK